MRIFYLLVAATAISLPPVYAQSVVEPIYRYNARHHPLFDREGMVASQHRLASRIGATVLAQGGNAVDAAVAVGFSLAVALPRAGNIGGGGFMLLHIASNDETIAIDFRERAPARATRDMFLDENGDVDPVLSKYSHLASGVPGTVAGLWLAHDKYGRLPWKSLLEPAIALARNGVAVTYDLEQLLVDRKERLSNNAATQRYFYKDDGQPYLMGETLVQTDLARTLQLIADEGRDAFYQGEIAELIVAEMQANGGLIDAEALAAYEPAVRAPVRGTYRGMEIVSMPPSSSGGIHIIQMLNIMEHFPLRDFGPESADGIHLLAEVMKLAYADRSEHLGDTDFYDVPVEWLTSKQYAAELARTIDLTRARPSTEIKAGTPGIAEGPDTTHFSVMDRDGNAVATTYTLNFSYGSGISVPGAGFLLNNEMDDFVAKPGVPNEFGLLGGDANAIAGNKRPLSSMTPAMVFDEGKPVLVTGSPGGSRIITTVLQMIVNVIDHGMNIADATAAPRIHHQWFPDRLEVESGIAVDTIEELARRGHQVLESPAMGSLQSVMFRDGFFQGASDPRRPTAGSAGPASIAAGSQL